MTNGETLMESHPLHATTKVKIICPSKAKEPYARVISELATRAKVQMEFTKNIENLQNPIVLDERGELLTPKKIETLLSTDSVFVVGGPDGIDLPGKKYSLGPYTLNHQIAIIVLLDLIFRARNPNHPYNKH